MLSSLKYIVQKSACYDGVRPLNIYLLRLLYVLMFFVLGRQVWAHIFTHRGPWVPTDAVVWCLWAAFATLAGLGIVRPLKMLPIVLLEIFYKLLWLGIVAYPLWRTGTLAGSPAEGIAAAFLWVPLPILATPWGYVVTHYLYQPKTRPWCVSGSRHPHRVGGKPAPPPRASRPPRRFSPLSGHPSSSNRGRHRQRISPTRHPGFGIALITLQIHSANNGSLSPTNPL